MSFDSIERRWEDPGQCWFMGGIFERPGFQSIVDEKTIRLKNILGRYSLLSKNPCGLKGCRTPHNRGYLVLLEGGLETNIGNICGKKHFNVDFDKSKASFTRAVNAQRYRENIDAKQSLLPRLKERLETLQTGPDQTGYCYLKMHEQMTRLFDETTAKALCTMAKRGDGIITRDVPLSDEEKEFTVGGWDRTLEPKRFLLLEAFRQRCHIES